MATGASPDSDLSRTGYSNAIGTTPQSSRWLFSAPVDLAAFLGSAAVSIVLLAIGQRYGLLENDSPDWTWISLILLIDVAHVYATAFRVYFDRAEFQRRTWLYLLTPALAYLIGVALYSEGERHFWRVLAYLAVFHFVRQQYGWVALYRSKCGETGAVGRWIDTAAIYAATCYPLIYWHCRLPRQFSWFVEDDFSGLPSWCASVAAPVYLLALGSYVIRSIYRGVSLRRFNPGKDIVVATTAVCWYLGIVAFNSDYAFTVTNVVIHGVPYLVLVYWYWSSRSSPPGTVLSFRRGIVVFLATVWLFAYVEELFWDRGVWHDRSWLFGESWELSDWRMYYVPLLAVPQVTHYLLDGFIWRRRSNPRFSRLVPSVESVANSATGSP
ncbi:MAG: hypothetical protein AB7O26_10115 [Planctomycetaceae bacterium]